MTRSHFPIALIQPNILLAAEFQAYARDYLEAGDGRYLPYLEVIRRDFETYVHELAARSRADNLPPERVPQSTFWLVCREKNGATRMIGTSRLRHRLNEHLQIMGGHIGYEVRPNERGKGYGSQILARTLTEAKNLGLVRVLLTCDVANVASARVIEKNGGVLYDRMVPPFYDQEIARYWIDLNEEGGQA